MSGLRVLAGAAVILALLGAGCGGTPPRAPVSERGAAQPKAPPAKPAATEPDWRPNSYTVKKGDTLYGIALEHGLDYRELAAWNNIENPSRIRIGQPLRLAPPEESVVVTPARAAAGVEVRPLGTAPAPAEAPRALAEAPRALAEAPRAEGLKTGPKALKLPYSEQNLALIQGAAPTPAAKPEPARAEAPATPAAKPEPAKAEAPAKPPAAAAAEEPGDEETLTFAWPTQGKVLTPFSEGTKGVDIAGRAGQPVLASAAGK
ncbi:MAG TPA: LysM peptidoglycan-binding domain-containing protein, partial [Burkholderiales bacterium]